MTMRKISDLQPLTVVQCNNQMTAKSHQDYWEFPAVYINSVQTESSIFEGKFTNLLLMYAQNRLFYVLEKTTREWSDPVTLYDITHYYMMEGDEKLDDYVVIPKYDQILEQTTPDIQMFIEQVEF